MIRLTCSILVLILTTFIFSAHSLRAATESEANDNYQTANPIDDKELMGGAIQSLADEDYFSIDATDMNTGWGIIALLQTDQSSTSTDGVLTMIGPDGTTELQTDTGSWNKGSGIALQNFGVDNSVHYLRVNEAGDNLTISDYTLRYYNTIVKTQPEIEPNETRLSGTPSVYTNEGVLSSSGDKDCFAFHGRSGDKVLLALNGDPEGNSSPVDPVLELLDPNDTVLATSNFTGIGGKEFIEYSGLSEGLYAYCVSASAGVEGPTATYKAGIVRNGGLYKPAYTIAPTWTNLQPGNISYVGKGLTIKLLISNDSPLIIPGEINMSVRYDQACLKYISASLTPTAIDLPIYGRLETRWDSLKTDLAPGEEYSILVNFKGLAECTGKHAYQVTEIPYFFTGIGLETFYTIVPDPFPFPWPIFFQAIIGNL